MSTWTFRQQLHGSEATYTLLDGVADHGTAILAFFVFNTFNYVQLWRSTNGGATWTSVTTSIATGGSMGKIVYAGVIGGNKTWYVFGSSPGASYQSTDDGQTWSAFTDAMSGGGANGGASDSAGTSIAGQNNGANVESTVNGSALSLHSTPADWSLLERGGMIWDGSQFVALAHNNPSNPNKWSVFTAPSGFLATAGPTWTEAAGGGSNQWISYNSGETGAFCFVSAIGYAATITIGGGGSRIVISSTPGGLVTATPQIMTQDSGSGGKCLCGIYNQLLWGNAAGNVYRSSDGTTWIQDSLSQAWASGETPGTAIYDRTNATFILAGNHGSVYTMAAPVSWPAPVLSATWAGDTTSHVNLTWTQSGEPPTPPLWDIFRNGALLSTVSTPSFVDTSAQPGTSYSYYVYAADINNVSASPNSNIASVTTPELVLVGHYAPGGSGLGPNNSGGGSSPSGGGSTGSGSGYAAFSLPGAYPASVIANAGTITPKIYMPQENTTVKA